MQIQITQRFKIALASFAIVIALVLFVVTPFVYFFPRNSVSEHFYRIMPYPALFVGLHPILFDDINHDLASVRRFYESQSDDFSKLGLRVDFSTPEGQKRLMVREKELINKKIEDKAIEILLAQKNIVITPEEVSKNVDQKLAELGSKDAVQEKLAHIYNWNISDFEYKVVQPAMRKDALEKAYKESGVDTSSQAKKKIDMAWNDLKAGVSFDDVAKKYSEGATAPEGGVLGWVDVSTLAPEIGAAIKNQKARYQSPVIESSLGFHIIGIEERKQEEGRDMVHLKQIFTKKIAFSDWLGDQMKQMNIVVLFKGYKWDAETARMEFSQSDMRDFEEELLKTSQGDASLIF